MNEDNLPQNDNLPEEGEILQPEVVSGVEQRTLENVMEDSFFRYSINERHHRPSAS